VAATRAEAEREGLALRVRDLGAVVGEARTELERARRLAGEQTALAERGEAEVAALCLELERLATARAETEGQLDTLRTTERAGREAIEAYRRRVDAATRELEDLGARLAEARLAEQRVRLAREELSARVQEDLGIGAGALLDGFVPEAELSLPAALEALDRRVAELKAELDRLGPVNTEAVHELEEAASRSQFLGTQRGDLAHSQKSLAEAIRRMDEESERLFLETFHEVREHFQALVRQLFGGGKADLALAEGLPALEAGIEISARPPGREMLPIGLLSGGQRTMTALALLFAVFRARPSPFCVLDEVDAALDDANIGRFLAMLDSFRATTQFIVVTHNKGTMAACERLYGITMQTKGVSTHVAVEFEKVDGFVPEARGNASEAGRARQQVASAEPAPELSEAEFEIPTPPHRPTRPEAGGNGAAPAAGDLAIDLAPEPAEA
jgi:chromosome segregation protein